MGRSAARRLVALHRQRIPRVAEGMGLPVRDGRHLEVEDPAGRAVRLGALLDAHHHDYHRLRRRLTSHVRRGDHHRHRGGGRCVYLRLHDRQHCLGHRRLRQVQLGPEGAHGRDQELPYLQARAQGSLQVRAEVLRPLLRQARRRRAQAGLGRAAQHYQGGAGQVHEQGVCRPVPLLPARGRLRLHRGARGAAAPLDGGARHRHRGRGEAASGAVAAVVRLLPHLHGRGAQADDPRPRNGGVLQGGR
mmetsp:Transcript_78573/g.189766  ORF Transcript_78573/g.189766 Transcript_78573/m.189766 type:complete len:247 (+) Transcript_78573:1133-1873(+)